jgi:hypothetical protein
LAAGQKVEPTPLPELKPYARREASLTRWENENGEVSPLPKTAQDRIDAERDPTSKIVVRETVDKLHPLVQKAAAKLKRAEADVEGFVWSGNDTLDVKVSPASRDRALRILDALMKALAARKLQVEVVPRDLGGNRSNPDAGTRVRVLDEWLMFRLYERYSIKERPKDPKASGPSWLGTRTRKVPNGRLVLGVTNRSDLGHSLDVGMEWSEDRKPLFGGGLRQIQSRWDRDPPGRPVAQR